MRAASLRLLPEQERGCNQERAGNRACKPDAEPEQESPDPPPVPAPPLEPGLQTQISNGGKIAVGERTFALNDALRHIFGDRRERLEHIDRLCQHLAAVAGVLQETIDALVTAHVDMCDGINP